MIDPVREPIHFAAAALERLPVLVLGQFALLPACTTHSNNRLLFFAGLCAMGLLSQVWHGLVDKADWLSQSRAWRLFAHYFIAAVTGFHLLVSPLLLPLSVCSIVLTGSAERAIDSLGENKKSDLAGKDLIIVLRHELSFCAMNGPCLIRAAIGGHGNGQRRT